MAPGPCVLAPPVTTTSAPAAVRSGFIRRPRRSTVVLSGPPLQRIWQVPSQAMDGPFATAAAVEIATVGPTVPPAPMSAP
jgi:hypothetical protein